MKNIADRKFDIYVQEEPTEDEIENYARFIGIDPDTDRHLMWIAREGITSPLPSSWVPSCTSGGILYYYNPRTGEGKIDHPLDGYYRRKVGEEKKRKRNKKIFIGNRSHSYNKSARNKKSIIEKNTRFRRFVIHDDCGDRVNEKKTNKNFSKPTHRHRPDVLRKNIFRKKMEKEKSILRKEVKHLQEKKDEVQKVLDSTISKMETLRSRLSQEKSKFKHTLQKLQNSISNKQKERKSVEEEMEKMKDNIMIMKHELQKKIKRNQKNILVNRTLQKSEYQLRKDMEKTRKDNEEQKLLILRNLERLRHENEILKKENEKEKTVNHHLKVKHENEMRRSLNQIKTLTETKKNMTRRLNDQQISFSSRRITQQIQDDNTVHRYIKKIDELEQSIRRISKERDESHIQITELQKEQIESEKAITTLLLQQQEANSNNFLKPQQQQHDDEHNDRINNVERIEKLDKRIQSVCVIQSMMERRNCELKEMNEMLTERNLRMSEDLLRIQEELEDEKERGIEVQQENQFLKKQIVEFEIESIERIDLDLSDNNNNNHLYEKNQEEDDEEEEEEEGEDFDDSWIDIVSEEEGK